MRLRRDERARGRANQPRPSGRLPTGPYGRDVVLSPSVTRDGTVGHAAQILADRSLTMPQVYRIAPVPPARQLGAAR